MQFYLLFPLLIYLFRRPNGPIFVYAVIALVSVVGQFAARPSISFRSWPRRCRAGQAYLADGYFYCWLPHQAICFGFGILLYDCIAAEAQADAGRAVPGRGFAVLLGMGRGSRHSVRAGLCWCWPRTSTLSLWLPAGPPFLRDLPRAFRRGVGDHGAVCRWGLCRCSCWSTGAALAVSYYRDRALDRTPLSIGSVMPLPRAPVRLKSSQPPSKPARWLRPEIAWPSRRHRYWI